MFQALSVLKIPEMMHSEMMSAFGITENAQIDIGFLVFLF